MRKFTFIFAFIAIAFSVYSQPTMVVTAPQNLTTTQVRAPNGLSTHAYLRASSLVLASELTTIPMSTTLTSFGFTTTAGASSAVTGTMTVYLENTTDVTFNKGTTWSTIISPMTTVYTGTYVVPANATTIDLTLSTPFVYTGGGIYVAYDFVSSGPFATPNPATYGANSALTNGCVSGSSSVSAPTTLGTTNFRPSFRWGYPNPLTNDVSVEYVNTMGDVALALSIPSIPLSAIVKNNSNAALTNIPVTANMTGANSFANTQTVSSLGAGATTTVNFGTGWMPLTAGASTITVSVPSDQNNGNNSRNFNNMTSCNTGGFAQNPANFTQSIGFGAASGILSTLVQLPVNATVNGVNVAIASNTPSIGRDVYGVMLDASGNILTTSSNTLTIANGNLGTIHSFSFTSPQSVTAGQTWYVGMAQTATAGFTYYPFGSYVSPYLNSSYHTNAITGGTLALLTTNLGQFGITAQFAGVCGPLGVQTVSSSDNNLVVYPNPATTVLNVKLGSVTDKATVVVYNAIGQVVIPAQEISDNSAELNVATLAKGVYILKVSNGKEVSNTKFVIER